MVGFVYDGFRIFIVLYYSKFYYEKVVNIKRNENDKMLLNL